MCSHRVKIVPMTEGIIFVISRRTIHNTHAMERGNEKRGM